ncbi:MAG: amidohydrolase [Proteobacteria bacterium]|nr:amidohydrolase [Pseudomonadota bacterium]
MNGKIFTGNSAKPYAEAVAVRDDKILAVGSRRDVQSSVSSSARVVDLEGKLLLPGLIDSHAHVIDGGIDLILADAKGALKDLDALEAFVAEAKRSGRGLRGDVLRIEGISLGFWSQIAALNERFNAGAYAHQPLFLGGLDGHTGWANLALRERAGLNKAYVDSLPEDRRGHFGLNPDGTPNGFASEEGLHQLTDKIPKPDARTVLEGARAGLRYFLSLGITSWLDPAVSERFFSAYKGLSDRGELTAHVAALPVVEPDSAGSWEAALALRAKYGGVPHLSIPGIKVFADGVAEYPSQTAAMTTPYSNTGKTGDLLFKPENFAKLCINADRAGLLVHVHAIGDRAVHEALNGFEAARKANGDSGIPHTITHLQFVREDDIERFKQLGVLASFQLFWAQGGVETIDLVKPYVAADIYPWQYPARSMLDAGAIIAGASDWDVTTPNVFEGIYEAETRRGTEGVLDASQDVPREAMLYAYTINAAKAMRLEKEIGSIEPGKAADLILVDRDVLIVAPEELRDTRVLWTMVAGKKVYPISEKKAPDDRRR